MPSLSWTDFDGPRFQQFCNSLLLFEVSKFAHVFTAAGADAGVDQYFTGTYGGKTGKWRFQDKFHHSAVKSADVAALKREIREDINTNYKDENFIVFITNLNLTTAQYTSMLKESADAITAKNIQNCSFSLWHEPTIESLLVAHAILFQQYWERDTVLLQSYEGFFSHQLEGAVQTDRYQLRN